MALETIKAEAKAHGGDASAPDANCPAGGIAVPGEKTRSHAQRNLNGGAEYFTAPRAVSHSIS